MYDPTMSLANRWFDWLAVPRHKQDVAWHQEDQSSELKEFQEATSWLSRWSESSDVVFTNLRSHWDEVFLEFPLSRWRFATGYAYGLFKYTLRFLFYRRLGKKFGKDVRAIRNPARIEKLRTLAEMHGIDPDTFVAEAKRMRYFWPLLP